MRSALFQDVTQRTVVITDVSGHSIVLIFNAQETYFCLTFNPEEGTDMLSRNVSRELPL